MPTLSKITTKLKIPGFFCICLITLIFTATVNAAETGEQATREKPAYQGKEHVPETDKQESSSPEAQTRAMPAKAPDFSAASRYVKQTGVIDTSPVNAATQTRGKKAPAPNPKNDLDVLSLLAVPGWEGLEAQKFSLSKNLLVNSAGKAVEEVQGKPASVLIEYGCTEVASRRFQNKQHNCEASLFRFASPSGAYGSYTTLRGGSSTIVVRGQASSEDDGSISFYSGNALVCLRAAEDDDEAKGILGLLADQIGPYLSGGPPVPELVLSLPRLNRLSGSEKFFMGFQSANRYCNIPFLSDLLSDQARQAVSADYLYPRPRSDRLKLFLAEYNNQAGAQKAFDSCANSISSSYRKMLDKSNNQIFCKMSDSYLMCGTKGLRVWIIAGAKRASSPGVLSIELVSH